MNGNTRRAVQSRESPSGDSVAITPQTLSLEEFLELLEEKPALEDIDGRIVQKVPPQWQHAMLQLGRAELINRADIAGGPTDE